MTVLVLQNQKQKQPVLESLVIHQSVDVNKLLLAETILRRNKAMDPELVLQQFPTFGAQEKVRDVIRYSPVVVKIRTTWFIVLICVYHFRVVKWN